MEKIVIYAFKGDEMCFVHVLLNTLDMYARGMDARVVIEGEAVTLVRPMTEGKNPLFEKAKAAGLLDCICKACSAKMGVLEYNENSGIPVKGDMGGHPAMAGYIDAGYRVITL